MRVAGPDWPAHPPLVGTPAAHEKNKKQKTKKQKRLPATDQRSKRKE
jgi:hypothetical protein